jgi:hypothetical protein
MVDSDPRIQFFHPVTGIMMTTQIQIEDVRING